MAPALRDSGAATPFVLRNSRAPCSQNSRVKSDPARACAGHQAPTVGWVPSTQPHTDPRNGPRRWHCPGLALGISLELGHCPSWGGSRGARLAEGKSHLAPREGPCGLSEPGFSGETWGRGRLCRSLGWVLEPKDGVHVGAPPPTALGWSGPPHPALMPST